METTTAEIGVTFCVVATVSSKSIKAVTCRVNAVPVPPVEETGRVMTSPVVYPLPSAVSVITAVPSADTLTSKVAPAPVPLLVPVTPVLIEGVLFVSAALVSVKPFTGPTLLPIFGPTKVMVSVAT